MAESALAEHVDPGTELELAAAREPHGLVRARGSLFVVTTRDGNVMPAGARELGLFDRDTRHLSHWELSLHGGRVVYLSGEASGDTVNRIDLMMTGDEKGNLDDPSNFLHVCRLQLVDAGGFVETIQLQSFVARPLELELSIDFAADFADVFEVRGAKRARRGRVLEPKVTADSVELSYRGLDGVEYASELCFDPPPAELGAGRACFRLTLASRECVEIRAEVTTSRRTPSERRAARCAPAGFRERVEELRREAESFRASCARIRCNDPVMQAAFDRASGDLRSLWLREPHPILAAGIPWFCCAFGRDSLIASYEALLLQPELAAGTLRTLAALQGTRADEFTEEEPGKILHELRMGEMVRTGELPHRPYYGSIDSTPLFIVVAHAYWEVTGDLDLIRSLEESLRAALAWIDARSAAGTELVTYARKSAGGLDNQGWKDSRSGVCFPDGRQAVPPIALAEVQGYAVDAYVRGAAMLAALGDEEGANTYGERAERMAALVDDRLWISDLGRYAFAIDGEGRRLDTVVSNVGHLLWSRVPDAARAEATARLLTQRDGSLGELGIRTLAAGQPAYNPLSYHEGSIWPHDNALVAMGMSSYRLAQPTLQVLETMREALSRLDDYRLPELYAGIDAGSALVRYPVACSPQAWAAAAPFLVLQATLGIHFDAPHGTITIRDPHLPSTIRELEIENLRVGDARLAIRFRQVGKRCHVDRLDFERGTDVRALVELGA